MEMSPQIVAAIMVLLIGWTVGRLVGKAFSKAFAGTGLEQAVRRTVVGLAVEKWGMSCAAFFDQLIRWSIYLITILAAIDLLQLEAASAFTQRVFDYVPHLVGGIVILFVGLVVADFIGNAIRTLAGEMELMGALSRVFKVFFYFVVVVTALAFMQIDVSLLRTFGTAMAWGMAIAFGIAFGLGFKDYVAKNADRWVVSGLGAGKKKSSDAIESTEENSS